MQHFNEPKSSAKPIHDTLLYSSHGVHAYYSPGYRDYSFTPDRVLSEANVNPVSVPSHWSQ